MRFRLAGDRELERVAVERQQITEWAKQYGASLVLYARQWTRDPDDALQEALIDLLAVAEPPRDPPAWLFMTVKRKAMNQARGEARRRKHTESLATHQDAWFETNHELSLLAEEVRLRLQQLSDVEREIVVARVWGDLNWEQIGDLVGQPRSTVHRRYQTALRKLADQDAQPNNKSELANDPSKVSP